MRHSIRHLLSAVVATAMVSAFFTGCDSGSSTSSGNFAITAQPAAQTVASGNPVSLTLTATGDNLTYRWVHSYKWISTTDGLLFDTASFADSVGASSSYTIPLAAPFDSGSYKCVIHSGIDSLVSNPVTVKVTPVAFPAALMSVGMLKATNICLQCHDYPPKGTIGTTPPLIHSDYLLADKLRPVRVLFLGLGDSGTAGTNPIFVNGIRYEGQMPAVAVSNGLSDSEIAGVLTYMRGTFNGATDMISPAEVKQERDSLRAHGHLEVAPN